MDCLARLPLAHCVMDPTLDSSSSPARDRLLDANLDRAREGLRVLEDWARFGLDRGDLVVRTKDMRQRLGRLHRDAYKFARHTATDPAAGLGHPAQAERRSPSAVVGANAFAHASGIHQDGVLKNVQTFEIMRPEDIGLTATNIAMGKHSGRAALRSKLKELGFDLAVGAVGAGHPLPQPRLEVRAFCFNVWR